ncbi:DUF2971 domain-containing protein [Bradyrhizobium sp. CIR3A]|uniref:DUF2971 domain-containing protein n=1 Tax=Bradyrhizobium sp. CIR3A TaxID=2663838 RepID=UPI001606D594|nr:DUF2971 domain-containing protein [Bradyrhizobium sp. CIR3A]MBB4263579.1 hypothetical protein [Bradyrhizobium sp. CIR3A]
MSLPPLYKYLNVEGAKLTLGNRCFKHAKPSDFNDIEDLTINSLFPEETEAALTRLSNGFTDVILRHLNDPPTCASPMREKVALIQHVYRTNPQAAEMVKAEIAKGDKPVFDVEHMRARAETFIKEINDYMQGCRVLCVTTHKDSEAMWSGYAENHKGIAIRIEPNLAKDSKFQLFKPVVYREKRPPLYDDTLEFIVGGLFGNLEQRCRAALDKIAYAKTLPWQHEGEYRLVIPLRQGEEPWNTLAYHPEEITELYLGAAMTDADRQDIVAKAKALNPLIAVFQAKRDNEGRISFDGV